MEKIVEAVIKKADLEGTPTDYRFTLELDEHLGTFRTNGKVKITFDANAYADLQKHLQPMADLRSLRGKKIEIHMSK